MFALSLTTITIPYTDTSTGRYGMYADRCHCGIYMMLLLLCLLSVKNGCMSCLSELVDIFFHIFEFLKHLPKISEESSSCVSFN